MSFAKLASFLVLGTLALAHVAPAAEHGAYFDPTLRSDGQGSLEVTFGIEEAARVSLVAFDAQGKVVATLIDGNQVSGFHHISLFSNRLQGQDRRVIYELRAGDAVLAQVRAVSPDAPALALR